MRDEAHARLYKASGAARWDVSAAALGEAVARGVAKAFEGREPGPAERERYVRALHLEDLALAVACAQGHEAAWDHFVATYRPVLYRAADALAPGGAAREVADAVYAELFGVKDGGGVRPSLFRYFHGRSSLATWLRSMVSQRYVDRLRTERRVAPLPDEDTPATLPAAASPPDPDRRRFTRALGLALGAAIAALAPRDRMRLACYHAQEMTLAAIGRLTGEHEATVSRHLTRTRRWLRAEVETRLRRDAGFGDREIDECFAAAMDDAGPLDLGDWLDGEAPRKDPPVDRSMQEDLP